MAPRIGVIGSINADLVTFLERLPQRGETLDALGFELHHGGKGANQAVAAARLGSAVVMVGKVGADVFGDNALANLQAHGIDTRHVGREVGVPTGLATILVEASGDNRIMIVAGANGRVLPDDIDRAADDLLRCDLILLQLEIPLATVHCAIRFGTEHAKAVVLNPAPARPGLDPELLRQVTFLVPNRTELAHLSGRPVESIAEVAAASRTLLPPGTGAAVIATMGAEGAFVSTERESAHVPGVAVKPVDTTGAGDAFIGSFAHFYLLTRDVTEATRRAVRYAALSITRRGAQGAYADAAEFAAFCDRIDRGTAE
jgi:ribokinase